MELYYVMSIVDRDRADVMQQLHDELDLSLALCTPCKGTATSEHLLLYDLRQSGKIQFGTVATRASMQKLMNHAKRRLYIDIPGNGIMLAIPLKAVSGGKTLTYLTQGQTPEGGTPPMQFDYELIVVILNEGYSDTVMDAARAAGATGGTVLHAKGSGREKAEKFYGVSLTEQKDMIYILAATGKKSAIMQQISRDCGIGKPPSAICFSLPVSEVAGLRNPLDQ